MGDVKQETLRKLDEALMNGLVDQEVIPLLEAINKLPWAVTTSSCSGRLMVISVPEPGDKLGSTVLGKWHRTVSSEEVLDALGKWNGSGQVHLLVQPLLLHIRCMDIVTASELRNLANGNGLKFSTIRSIRTDHSGTIPDWGVVVEFLGTERIEVPLHIYNRDSMPFIIPPLVVHGNELLVRIKERIPTIVSAILGMEINK